MAEDPPPPQARHELRWLGVVVVALAAQHLLVTGSLGTGSLSKYASGTSKLDAHPGPYPSPSPSPSPSPILNPRPKP